MNNFQTPILFVIFNRPETTSLVWQEIKKIKPARLFIAADGPRFTDELAFVNQTRNLVLNDIDWECEVKTLLREKNVGCKEAGVSGLSWFFDQVEEGIILEDDCVPNQTFFNFCAELLEKYRNDEEIMHISGNYFGTKPVSEDSYYFSHIPHIWGWATWRRAWQYYDVEMKSFPVFKANKKIEEIFKSKTTQSFWLDVFEKNYLQLDNGWDFQWTYTLFNNNGKSINPNVNLVKNIGFGENATHSVIASDKLGNLMTGSIDKLQHPAEVIYNDKADRWTNRKHFDAVWPIYNIKLFLKKTIFFNFAKKIYHHFK